jgi:hypothetical protein
VKRERCRPRRSRKSQAVPTINHEMKKLVEQLVKIDEVKRWIDFTSRMPVSNYPHGLLSFLRRY